MEHRQHVRFDLDLDLMIYRRGLPVATGRMRNVSRQGLFVETDGVELRPHQRLECAYRPGDAPAGAWERIGAYVCRQGTRGVGLELDDDDADSLAALRALLPAAEKARNIAAGPPG